jgi:NADH-ubiquinone oxidoreductase chain 6
MIPKKENSMITEYLFYFFSSLAIASGIFVIRAQNPVHSVLFLILVFCQAAGLLILQNLDFFAMIFLVVYVGAIAVLFLFVVMMLHIKVSELHENALRYLPIGGFIGLIFVLEVLLVVENDLIPYGGGQNQESILGFGDWIVYLFMGLPLLFDPTRSFRDYVHDLGHLRHSDPMVSSADFGFHFPEVYTEWMRVLDQMTNLEALGHVLYTYYAYFFLVASLILLIAMMGAIALTLHRSGQVRRQEVFEQNLREYTKTIQKVSFGNELQS